MLILRVLLVITVFSSFGALANSDKMLPLEKTTCTLSDIESFQKWKVWSNEKGTIALQSISLAGVAQFQFMSLITDEINLVTRSKFYSMAEARKATPNVIVITINGQSIKFQRLDYINGAKWHRGAQARIKYSPISEKGKQFLKNAIVTGKQLMIGSSCKIDLNGASAVFSKAQKGTDKALERKAKKQELKLQKENKRQEKIDNAI